MHLLTLLFLLLAVPACASTNFPTSLDSYTNPSAGTSLTTGAGGRSHSQMHADTFDAIESMQAVIGVTNSVVTTSLQYRVNTLQTFADSFGESVDDRVAALLVEGTGIDLTYNDGANTLTVAATNNGTVTSINLTAPAAGITVSGGPVTTSGSITLALADDLADVEALATTGFVKRVGAADWVTDDIDLTSDTTGCLPLSSGGTGSCLIPPAADRILIFDADGDGTVAGVIGTGLVYTQGSNTLAVGIGSTVQAYDADLTTWAGITPGTGVGTWLATPSSANLATAVTGETGSGALVFGTSPTIAAPTLAGPYLTGHVNSSGTALTSGSLSACGTSPSITGTDRKGIITIGAGGTGCIVAWANAYNSDPVCVVSAGNSAAASARPHVNANVDEMGISFVSASGGEVVSYICEE